MFSNLEKCGHDFNGDQADGRAATWMEGDEEYGKRAISPRTGLYYIPTLP
jgi:hypothetical protein